MKLVREIERGEEIGGRERMWDRNRKENTKRIERGRWKVKIEEIGERKRSGSSEKKKEKKDEEKEKTIKTEGERTEKKKNQKKKKRKRMSRTNTVSKLEEFFPIYMQYSMYLLCH